MMRVRIPAVAVLMLCGVAGAVETRGAAGGELEIVNQYARRGQYLGPAGAVADVWIESSVNPRLTFRASATDYLQIDQGWGVGEAIFDVGVRFTPTALQGTAVTAGWIYYDRSNDPLSDTFQGDDTQEVYVGAEFDSWLQPWVYVLYDFDRGEGRLNDQVGTYLNAGVAHQWPLGDSAWSADAAARIGFDFGRNVDGFSDFLIRTGLRWHGPYGINVKPSIDWWFPSNKVDPNTDFVRPIFSLGVSYAKSY